MKLKKDIILSYIEQNLLTQKYQDGFTTLDISEDLNMQRTNVSSILNTLVKENKLVKSKGKPVKYYLPSSLKTNNNSLFNRLVGYDGSLKNAIRLAKAAIMYPEEKYFVLLKGENGTGKEFFARIMYEYAKEKKVINDEGKFNLFDVSFYLENEDSFNRDFYGDNGMLKASYGGMLFIKHAELLDGKQIKKIFDTIEQISDANVFLVCGSEQKLSKSSASLLDSKFTIKVELPELINRSFTERLELVEHFFMDEAENVNKNIKINSELLRCLLLYPLQQNVKQLQADIRFACANAYVREINSSDTVLRVYLNDCPSYVRKGFIFYKNNSSEIESLIPDNYTYTFNSNRSKKAEENFAINNRDSIYDVINKKAKELRSRNIKEDDILTILSTDLESDLVNVSSTLGVSMMDREALKRLVNPYVVILVDDFLKEASEKLNRVFPIQVLCAIALDMDKIINKSSLSRFIPNEKVMYVIENYRNEYTLAQKFLYKLEQEFDINLPIDEAVIIAMLISGSILEKNKKEPITLVVMHGNIASSIANTVNDIYKSKHAYAYDLLLDKPLDEAYDELKNFIKTLDTGAGFLIIFDMGSIKSMCESIVYELNIKARLVEFPITAFTLDAVIRLSSGESIDSVYENILNHGFGAFSTLSKEYKRLNDNIKQVIISFCRTGEGSAKQIKSYIEKYVNLNNDTDVISVAVNDSQKLLEEVNKVKSNNVKVVLVGTFDPKIHDIPYISIAQLFQTEPEKLSVLLSLNETKDQGRFEYELMYDYLNEQLTNVSIKKLKRIVPPVINKIRKTVDNFTIDEEVGLFMHISCLISRLVGNEETPMNLKKDTIIARHKKLYNQLKQILEIIEDEFCVYFQDNDIATIIEIITE